MPTRAQLTQERSRQRREAMLAAAIELFAEGGSRAVTHRAVAKRAGLPAATTTYYFESIQDLLREALSARIQMWRDELDLASGLDQADALSGSILDLVDIVSAVFAARGPEVAAGELSIYLAATRDESLISEARAAVSALETLVITWLKMGRVPDPEVVAPSVLSLIGGVALRRQSKVRDESDEAQLLADAVLGLVAAHSLGRDKVREIVREVTAS